MTKWEKKDYSTPHFPNFIAWSEGTVVTQHWTMFYSSLMKALIWPYQTEDNLTKLTHLSPDVSMPGPLDIGSTPLRRRPMS